ncbi:hypothetical protein HK098_003434 [Nowakowskiella sp. JEL0407]|nr:hypothetical protein HK098_003434 [Nowakowskiella sp. JEL0407]
MQNMNHQLSQFDLSMLNTDQPFDISPFLESNNNHEGVEYLFPPLISPALTPSFGHSNNPYAHTSHATNYNNEPEISPITSPAMVPAYQPYSSGNNMQENSVNFNELTPSFGFSNLSLSNEYAELDPLTSPAIHPENIMNVLSAFPNYGMQPQPTQRISPPPTTMPTSSTVPSLKREYKRKFSTIPQSTASMSHFPAQQFSPFSGPQRTPQQFNSPYFEPTTTPQFNPQTPQFPQFNASATPQFSFYSPVPSSTNTASTTSSATLTYTPVDQLDLLPEVMIDYLLSLNQSNLETNNNGTVSSNPNPEDVRRISPTTLLKKPEDAKNSNAGSSSSSSTSVAGPTTKGSKIGKKEKDLKIDLVSPGLKPLKPKISGVDVNLLEKSNYENILEGGAGLNFPAHLADSITARKTTHKQAEQFRRDNLKNSFEELKSVLPGNKAGSRVIVLKNATKYITHLVSNNSTLKSQNAELLRQNQRLENEIRKLKGEAVVEYEENDGFGDDDYIGFDGGAGGGGAGDEFDMDEEEEEEVVQPKGKKGKRK